MTAAHHPACDPGSEDCASYDCPCPCLPDPPPTTAADELVGAAVDPLAALEESVKAAKAARKERQAARWAASAEREAAPTPTRPNNPLLPDR